ncbi:MAG: N-acetylmuramoyl-L-alanine amidase [Planctomycetota bacterium]|nr:MAG: N-acetylmuramoyl-L-alanine amidase [Planctomycetota bacterium]
MSNQPRVAKVLAALLISMTVGAVVLMALSNEPPSAGPFCLSSYYRLDPVEKTVTSRAAQSPNRWNCIEIYYSDTKAGNIEQLVSLNGLTQSEDINCHFVICNGLGANDGQIQPTEKWQRQWSIIPGRTWYGTGQTIRICIIANGKTSVPTDFQIKRAEALIEALRRKFDIHPENIHYPGDWK